jgi:lipoprotein-releasing system ATP-binding protein
MSEAAGNAVLRASGLHKRFREGSGREQLDVTVLSGLSLEVRRAQTLAVVGASGSGKSTLLHLLGGLDQPTSCKVELTPAAGVQRARQRGHAAAHPAPDGA